MVRIVEDEFLRDLSCFTVTANDRYPPVQLSLEVHIYVEG